MPLGLLLDVPYQLALAISLALAPVPATANRLAVEAAQSADVAEQARSAEDKDGAYGFNEQAWLKLVKSDGPKIGLKQHAERIFVTTTGRYYAPVPGERAVILALRRNPSIAATLARENAKSNLASLAASLARMPTGGELYCAHRIGPETTAKLVALARSKPAVPAAPEFPDAAAAAPELFFDGRHERSFAQLKQAMDEAYVRSVTRPRGPGSPPVTVSLGEHKTSEARAELMLPEPPKRTTRKQTSVAALRARGGAAESRPWPGETSGP